MGCTSKNFDRHVDTWWSHTFRQTDSFFCRLRRGVIIDDALLWLFAPLVSWTFGSQACKGRCTGASLSRSHHLPSGPQVASTIRTHKTLFVRFGLGYDNGWPEAKATFAREGPQVSPGAHFPQLRQDLLRADSTQKLSRCVASRLHQLSRASSTVRAL